MDQPNEFLKDEAIRKLEQSLAELQRSTRQALGFVNTIEYRGVPFNVSQRFVIADLAPLAFFHLVEHIHTDLEAGDRQGGDVQSAIVRLYDRLGPLLTCRHEWLPLKRADDAQIRIIVGRRNQSEPGPYVCRFCTAYSLGHPLPFIGRDLYPGPASEAI